MVFERYQSWQITQKDSETVDQFVTRLKNRVKSCEYESVNDMVRDKFMFSWRDLAVKERLLRNEKLTLEKGICMARASEASKEQIKAMAPKEHSNENPSLNKIQHGGKQKKNSPRRPGSRGSGPTSQQGNCKFCGSSHSWGFCPTFGKTCGYCQRKDHFACVCRKKLQDLGGKTVSAMAEETDESDAGADLLTFSFKSSSESPLQDD